MSNISSIKGKTEKRFQLNGLPVILAITILLSGLWGCDVESKYKNDILQLERLSKYADTLSEDLGKATKRINAGRAIIDFIRAYRFIKPDIDKMIKTYPGLLKSSGVENPPEELKPYFKNVTESLNRMKVILDGKKARFGGNKDFLKVVFELKEIMYYY